MTIKMIKFKVLAQFVKDMSSETKDVQTFLFVKDYISKYNLSIDITSNPTKNNLIEVNTALKFEDKESNEKKSHFEITYTSIIKIEGKIENKDELKKIILRDVQKEVYPNIEKAFSDLLINSGYRGVNFKEVDFDKLYNEKLS